MVAQIVAAELHLPLEQIQVSLGDTATTPYYSGAHASRSAFTTGRAAKRAVEDAREQLFRVAADLLEASAADLELTAGHVQVKGVPARAVPLRAVAERAYHTVTEIVGKGLSPFSNARPYGAHFVDLSVNEETVQVRFHRHVAVHDVGRALNRAVVEGQIEGAAVRGIGFALAEEMLIDPETGSVMNAGLMGYGGRRAADRGDPPRAPGPERAGRGEERGEVGITPPAGGIANAVADALGVRVYEAPLTPERILAALEARGESLGERLVAEGGRPP